MAGVQIITSFFTSFLSKNLGDNNWKNTSIVAFPILFGYGLYHQLSSHGLGKKLEKATTDGIRFADDLYEIFNTSVQAVKIEQVITIGNISHTLPTGDASAGLKDFMQNCLPKVIEQHNKLTTEHTTLENTIQGSLRKFNPNSVQTTELGGVAYTWPKEETELPLKITDFMSNFVQKLITKNTDLTDELTTLQTTHNNKVIELNNLQTTHDNKVIEFNNLQTTHNNKVIEFNNLQTTHTNKVTEFDNLTRELNNVRTELDALKDPKKRKKK